MSALARRIADRIAREGPLPFSAFMEMALYDPADGYYCGDPFGNKGDFFTACQLQPVFGSFARALAESLDPAFENFTDIGAGREELRQSFGDKNYRAVQRGQSMPKTKTGILFANEFFDALPIDLFQDDVLLRVGGDEKKFVWFPFSPSTGVREVRPSSLRYVHEAWSSIESGFFIAIDYGYRKETYRDRFPHGSLMSYKKHVAIDDVLQGPGAQDITAHVDWDESIAEAESVGWSLKSLSTLRAAMLALGPEILESLFSLNKMQFRTLFFAMGESFEVLVMQKK